jgi:hypothetical protein
VLSQVLGPDCRALRRLSCHQGVDQTICHCLSIYTWHDVVVVQLPLQPKEVRGVEALAAFSKLMLQELDI